MSLTKLFNNLKRKTDRKDDLAELLKHKKKGS